MHMIRQPIHSTSSLSSLHHFGTYGLHKFIALHHVKGGHHLAPIAGALSQIRLRGEGEAVEGGLTAHQLHPSYENKYLLPASLCRAARKRRQRRHSTTWDAPSTAHFRSWFWCTGSIMARLEPIQELQNKVKHTRTITGVAGNSGAFKTSVINVNLKEVRYTPPIIRLSAS